MTQKVNPLIQLAQTVHQEMSSLKTLSGVLTYLEVSKETLDTLFKLSPVYLNLRGITIKLDPDDSLSGMYLIVRPICGSLLYHHRSFFVVNPTLPKGIDHGKT